MTDAQRGQAEGRETGGDVKEDGYKVNVGRFIGRDANRLNEEFNRIFQSAWREATLLAGCPPDLLTDEVVARYRRFGDRVWEGDKPVNVKDPSAITAEVVRRIRAGRPWPEVARLMCWLVELGEWLDSEWDEFIWATMPQPQWGIEAIQEEDWDELGNLLLAALMGDGDLWARDKHGNVIVVEYEGPLLDGLRESEDPVANFFAWYLSGRGDPMDKRLEDRYKAPGADAYWVPSTRRPRWMDP